MFNRLSSFSIFKKIVAKRDHPGVPVLRGFHNILAFSLKPKIFLQNLGFYYKKQTKKNTSNLGNCFMAGNEGVLHARKFHYLNFAFGDGLEKLCFIF